MKHKLSNYGNSDAHNQIKKLMLRGEKLTIGFFNEDITNYSCAWIESKTVSAFKYVIFKEDNVYWLMNYLINGEVEDIDAKPFGIQGEIETEEDFQLCMLKNFIESKMTVQFSPLSRGGSGFVRAISAFDNGKVIFKLKKTDELLEYLKARDFILL